jgi:hypothetical protein
MLRLNCSSPAKARFYEVRTEARKNLLQQLMSGLGVAAQKALTSR